MALFVAALLTACGEAPPAETKAAKAGATAAAGSAISVTSAPARRRDLPIQLEATGAVVPVTSVDVKPQLTSSRHCGPRA